MKKLDLNPKIHLSIVSHGQWEIVSQLLEDLKSTARTDNIYVTLTLNIDEYLPIIDTMTYPFPIRVERNIRPQGFAKNHNAAFYKSYEDTGYFCVLNPDIRLKKSPFPALVANFKDKSIGLVAPLIVSNSGGIEDSARVFPTPFKIICKAFGRCKGADYIIDNALVYPDWVGGMFMLFPNNVYKKIGGFDEKFFLYYEDVDICARLKLEGYKIILSPEVKVTHNAQRASHHSFKYLKWHINSMVRFFCSAVFIKGYLQAIVDKFNR